MNPVPSSLWRLFATLPFVLLTAAHVQGAERIPWTTSRVYGSPNPPAPLQVQRLFKNLTFERPVDIASLPGSDRWFVLEQSGKLYSFPARLDIAQRDLVFDFSQNHQPFDSAYAIAFHPKFAENRFIFVCYVEPSGRTNGSFVSRFKVSSSNPPVIEQDTETVFIRWLSGGHNGCTVTFGNDGYLYISTGDAGDPDPPDGKFRTGQDISDLLAGVLRLDVDHQTGTNAYSIPSDNPFRQTPGARPEVYAFGLRNPWRMSFDRATGDLWVADVGWEQWEMVYRVKPGGNYGWSITEGPNTHVRTDVKPGPGPILPPLLALPHSEGASITGGLVYHGKRLPKWNGAYIYGDWETGRFWALRHDKDKLELNDELCHTHLKPVSFAEDAQGELVILDYNGGLYEFAPNTAPAANAAFPRRLSETGLFQDLATHTPAPGVMSYSVNAGMWNDYASAERFLGVPGTNIIITAGGRETIAGVMWNFPSNTVLARTLTLEMKRGQPSTKRRIETQMLHFNGEAWSAYTFRWNTNQTDADLVPSKGTNDVFTLADPAAPGGQRDVPWRFLGRAECFRCHNAWAGETISFNWMQLNTPGPKTELQRLEQAGVLRVKARPEKLTPLPDPFDTKVSLNDRARSWLHVNCSGCHRYGAGGDVPAWFNYDQTLEQTRVYDAKPTRGDFGIMGARVIAPGDPYRSTLFYRINTEGSGRMPHIGSRVVDEKGVRLIRDWIVSLPARSGLDAEAALGQKLDDKNAGLLADDAARIRPEAIPVLLGTMNGCLAILGRTSDPQSRQDVATAAAAHTNALVRDLFQRLLPRDKRRQTLGLDFDPQLVLAMHGNAARGKEVFVHTAQCSRCHVCEGTGRVFGPDLSGISRKYNRTQLLEQVLYPSRVIAPEYKTINIAVRDGAELSGFVIKRDATQFVLRDANLEEHTVKSADVESTQESNVSSMPEGLLAPLTAEEVADLLEFISTSKPATL